MKQPQEVGTYLPQPQRGKMQISKLTIQMLRIAHTMLTRRLEVPQLIVSVLLML